LAYVITDIDKDLPILNKALRRLSQLEGESANSQGVTTGTSVTNITNISRTGGDVRYGPHLSRYATGTVNTSGTSVSYWTGDSFNSDWVGKFIIINGAVYQVATVPSAGALTITTSAGTQTDVPYYAGTLARTLDSGTFWLESDWRGLFVTVDINATVNTSGVNVSRVGGDSFQPSMAGGTVTIGGTDYSVSSVSGPSNLALTTTAGTQAGVSLSQKSGRWEWVIGGFVPVGASSTPTFDLSLGQNFDHTITHASEAPIFLNPKQGVVYTIFWRLTATGQYIVWPGEFKYGADLLTRPMQSGKSVRQSFYYDGANYFGDLGTYA